MLGSCGAKHRGAADTPAPSMTVAAAKRRMVTDGF